MLNKSINLQKEIKNESGNNVAFFSSQISMGYGNLNISLQIVDKEYVESNTEILNNEYDLFLQEVKKEAFGIGWTALAE